jgi:type II secretory pathway component PulF
MITEKISISNTEKLGLVGSLATMLTAGIPILDVVNSLREDSKGNQRKILDYMLEDLMQGKHIYLTFSRFPQVFDSVTVNVIKASEEAGTLEVALKDLKQTIQKDMEFSDRIRSALVYPVFIVGIFIAVLLMILVVVIPKISTVFSRLRVDLPLPTKVLIFSSNLLVHHTMEFLVGTGIVIGIFIVLYRSRKAAFLDFLYTLPLISTLVQQIDITRFSRSLHLLLSSGLPITGALELSEHVVVNRKTARVIAHSREEVLAGKSLSAGFREAKGYIPTIMIKLMESGEKTGSLERSMQDISEYFDYQVTTTLKTLTALLEPIMLVMVGVCVGGMMLAIIGPIYGMIGQVGAR